MKTRRVTKGEIDQETRAGVLGRAQRLPRALAGGTWWERETLKKGCPRFKEKRYRRLERRRPRFPQHLLLPMPVKDMAAFEKPALLLRLAISGGRAETASAPEPCWRGGGGSKKSVNLFGKETRPLKMMRRGGQKNIQGGQRTD